MNLSENDSARVSGRTLRGSVPTYWEKLRAHLLAARVEGVVHVIDELAVTPSREISDREIAQHLTQQLERRLSEDVSLVQTTVNNGVVTLRGSVPNVHVAHMAQRAAERIIGVVAVHNELTFPHPEKSS